MRFYEVNGILLPSVTTILDNVFRRKDLEHLRGSIGNDRADRQMEEAGRRGSLVHEYCRLINLGEPLPEIEDEQVAKMVEGYRQWFETTVEDVIMAEEVVYDLNLRYAGRPDALVIIKGDDCTTILDFKTGKPGRARLQLSAYQHICGAQRRMVVNINPKTGAVKTKEYEDDAVDFAAFMSALNLWWWAWQYEREELVFDGEPEIIHVPTVNCAGAGQDDPRVATAG